MSVSYTHLDVYKRQNEFRVERNHEVNVVNFTLNRPLDVA